MTKKYLKKRTKENINQYSKQEKTKKLKMTEKTKNCRKKLVEVIPQTRRDPTLPFFVVSYIFFQCLYIKPYRFDQICSTFSGACNVGLIEYLSTLLLIRVETGRMIRVKDSSGKQCKEQQKGQ